MSRNKKHSFEDKQKGYAERSKEAENNLAASTNENRNQKGHVPNSPSTG
ncbi:MULTISPECIES: hypothetical protein [Paenibacillus]|nr:MULTISPECIES: hypothetical protein [Paenibacillus]SIR04969.1 hypothetical protein SAMN05880555_2886 [Paenibacillus sp. RU4X]SIR30352.1 hypothetical protein SAMN05880570_3113 [Paenibacillus sp. RU4T]